MLVNFWVIEKLYKSIFFYMLNLDLIVKSKLISIWSSTFYTAVKLIGNLSNRQ